MFAEEGTLAKVIIRLQKDKENFMSRQYKNMPNLIAEVGGLLGIIRILGSLISKPFALLDRNKHMVDDIFNFDQKEVSK